MSLQWKSPFFHVLLTLYASPADNFSVYTIASVLKKFLRKLPEGIFGPSGEEELFHMIQLEDIEQKRDLVHRLIASRPLVTQHLLVLLFGTFR